MKVALAQINPTVADVAGNTARIIAQLDKARSEGARLVVFPELVMFGYPPKDLLLREDLVRENVTALERVAARCVGLTAVVGFVEPANGGPGRGLANAAAVCSDGKVTHVQAKMLLPTYDVFDETRHFEPSRQTILIEIPDGSGSTSLGVTICEDLWNDHQFDGRTVYGIDPVAQAVEAGATLLINIAASPYRAGKQSEREALFGRQVREHGVPLIYVNQVGGQDDLIFDGASAVFDAGGRVIARAKAFAEDLLLVDLPDAVGARIEPYPEDLSSIRAALVLGVRDYLRKCGFGDVLVGLSGGIDSALTAAIAVEAVGSECVHGVAMPSRYSSLHSVEDARQLADNLGIAFDVVPIESVHLAMEETLRPHFGNGEPGVAEENVQARIRGNILMALSNKFGWLLLTTGNKSELAVGYCTLYGDMCGGLAVLSDVPKTTVYALSRLMNETASRPWIPQRTIDKPPSAELREDQLDSDSLPPYDVLDAILERYVEGERAIESIVKDGYARPVVERIGRLVDRAEYKRKQAPVGLKVTSRAFGTGRRMPIAAKYH